MYTEKDLVRVAKRENNTKRNYLVVDPLQAKHVPVSPSKTLKLFTALADTVKGKMQSEKVLVVGFAETATAIGAQVAVSLGMNYMNTTREPVPNVEYMFFSEEHSHASEQKLIKNDVDAAVSEGVDTILFVEDEVTTGNTILNIVNILEKTYPDKLKYAVASLLNGMKAEHMEKYAARNIELFYLVKTNHDPYIDIADRFACDGIYELADANDNISVNEYILTGWMDTRRMVDGTKYLAAVKSLGNQIMDVIGKDKIDYKNVLVIGTEECMYPAIYVGSMLEENGMQVCTHSTTRSPIAVSMEADYPLHTRYELRSLYEDDRKTFIYDLDKNDYDVVIVITDAHLADNIGTNTLINAINKNNKNVYLFRWK